MWWVNLYYAIKVVGGIAVIVAILLAILYCIIRALWETRKK